MDRTEQPLLYTESETARLLGGISVSGLRKWRKAAKGPKYIRLGRLIRYAEDDIRRWLTEHTIDANNSDDLSIASR